MNSFDCAQSFRTKEPSFKRGGVNLIRDVVYINNGMKKSFSL